MAIPDSDPRARDLDAAFAQAMEGPAKPRVQASTPSEVDHDAPHGRDENGVALAPFGLTKEGKPKRSAGGRPPKDSPDSPRTGSVTELHPPGSAQAPRGKPAPRDWTEELDGLGDAVWFGLTAISKVGGNIPFLNKLVPETKLAAQAFIVAETKPRLVAAVNLAAQHNQKAADFCAKLEGGDGVWALTCMFMVMPVLSLSMTVWKGDEVSLKENELPSLAEMKKLNDDKMDQVVAKIEAQITAAAQAGQAPVDPGQTGV